MAGEGSGGGHDGADEVRAGVAALAAQFPDDYPRDPADRLIGATARAEGLPLVTRDEQIRRSNLLETIW